MKKHVVDDVCFISANDGFMMDSWAAYQDAKNIVLLPDGNGEFTRGMNILVDKSDIGFGQRSWRYSMLMKDGVVKKHFVELQQPGDPFEVSDADTMLAHIVMQTPCWSNTSNDTPTTSNLQHLWSIPIPRTKPRASHQIYHLWYSMLMKDGVVKKHFVELQQPGDPFEVSDEDTMLAHIAPGVKALPTVDVFTGAGYPYCLKAKGMLTATGLAFDEIQLGRDVAARMMKAITGRGTIPQVYMDGKHILFEDLHSMMIVDI